MRHSILAGLLLLAAACTDPANIATGGTGGNHTTSNSTDTGGGKVCTPGATMDCYSGPAGTEGIGACHAGTQTCNDAGTAWGPCTGEVTPKAEDCATPEDDACTAVIAPCGASTKWSKQLATPADPYPSWAVALDDAADVFFAGTFAGPATFDNSSFSSTGKKDLFLAKLSPSGATVWQKHIAADAQFPAVAADGLGNMVIAAGVTGLVDFGGGPLGGQDQLHDVVIAKLDKDGKYIWAKRAVKTGSDLSPGALTVAPNGDILFTVPSAALLDVGCGPTQVPPGFGGGPIVARLDKDGKCLWSTGFANTMIDAARIAFDASGNVYVAGSVYSGADFGGGPVGPPSGGALMFLTSLTPDGKHLDTKIWGVGSSTAPTPEVRGLAFDAGGNILLTGTFNEGSTLDFGTGPLSAVALGYSSFIAKLDASGAGIWSKTFGPDTTRGFDIAVEPGGDIVAIGWMQGTVKFGVDTLTSNSGTYLVRFNAGGAVLSADVLSGVSGARLVVDGKGSAIVAGSFGGTIDLGSGTLVCPSGEDAFVADVGP
jgi:hypothetical protein